MAARHLRPARGSALRTVLVALGVLLAGLSVGAGGVLVEDGRLRVGAGADDEPEGPGTARLVPDPGPITLALLGDLRIDGAAARRLDGSPDELLGPWADAVRDADLALANVEVPVVDGSVAVDGGDPAEPAVVLDGLAGAGIDVVSVANDHGLERGPGAIYETLTLEDARPEMVVGIGADEDAAYAPSVREVGGTTIAVVAATHVLPPERIADSTAGPDRPGLASAKRADRLVAEVAAAREFAELVVVVLHWGVEGETCPTAGQRELATALVDAGADVVAGSGARAVLGAGRSGSALVAYGLGGFLGGADGEDAGLLLVQVDDGVVQSHEWRPGRLVDGVAEPRAGDEAGIVLVDWDRRRECAGLDP